MKTRFIFSILGLLAWASVSVYSASAKDLVLGGDFEGGWGEWKPTIRSSGDKVELLPEAQSSLGSGQKGVAFKVVGDEGASPLLSYQFPVAATTPIKIKFDFSVPSGNTYLGGDGVLLFRLATNTGKYPTAILIRGDGKIVIGGEDSKFTWTKGVWQHVELTIPAGKDKAGKLELVLKGKDGVENKFSSSKWSATEVPADASAFLVLQIQTGFGRRAGTEACLDNVDIKTVE